MDITDAIPDMEKEDGSIYLLNNLHSAIDKDEFIKKSNSKHTNTVIF